MAKRIYVLMSYDTEECSSSIAGIYENRTLAKSAQTEALKEDEENGGSGFQYVISEELLIEEKDYKL